MLIFVKGSYLPLIASGRKTTTIRPWKVCKLVPGRSVLSFNGKIRATVTAVEQRRLGDLTAADAHADGFVSLAAFQRAFRRHYSTASADSLVWVIRFVLPKDSAQRARATA